MYKLVIFVFGVILLFFSVLNFNNKSNDNQTKGSALAQVLPNKEEVDYIEIIDLTKSSLLISEVHDSETLTKLIKLLQNIKNNPQKEKVDSYFDKSYEINIAIKNRYMLPRIMVNSDFFIYKNERIELLPGQYKKFLDIVNHEDFSPPSSKSN